MATDTQICETVREAIRSANERGDNWANAALIAAAPDYYAAAEAIRAHVVAAERVDNGDECSIPADLVRALLDAHRRAYATP